jgi:hypothetical protein
MTVSIDALHASTVSADFGVGFVSALLRVV